MELVGVIILCATAIIYFSIKQTTLLTLLQGFPPLPESETWQQEFDDEFDAMSLNNTYWVTCYDWYNAQYNGCSDTNNKDLEWYAPSQVSVENGYAQLSAIPSPDDGVNSRNKSTTYAYRSGMISTGRAYEKQTNAQESFLYGFFEARIRVTSGKGIWPTFQLMPANHASLPDIDIMQIIGDEPQNVVMTYVSGSAKNPQQNVSTFSGLTYYNNWHTYGVNWEPGHIDWYVDGILRKSVTGNNVPNQPMEMILNLAVGNTDNLTPFPAHMDIDWVRVYKPVLKS
jgi:beta-glucanase (GH16 family)